MKNIFLLMALCMLTFLGSAQPAPNQVPNDSVSYAYMPYANFEQTGNHLLFALGSTGYDIIASNCDTASFDAQGALDDLNDLPILAGDLQSFANLLDGPNNDGIVSYTPNFTSAPPILCCSSDDGGDCEGCWCWAYKCINCQPCQERPRSLGPWQW